MKLGEELDKLPMGPCEKVHYTSKVVDGLNDSDEHWNPVTILAEAHPYYMIRFPGGVVDVACRKYLRSAERKEKESWA